MTRMQGKAAIVTGAASGIGRATAILFAREGARVLLTDLDPAGEAVADSIRGEGGEVHFLRHDVSDEASWTTAIRRALEAFGRLDVLVNNAGISFAKPLGETTLAEWRQLMAVNLDGVFLGTREAVRAMRGSGGGAIINVSSASGLVGSPTASAYCASKGGVRLFTKAVALEVAGDGIRNCCWPTSRRRGSTRRTRARSALSSRRWPQRRAPPSSARRTIPRWSSRPTRGYRSIDSTNRPSAASRRLR